MNSPLLWFIAGEESGDARAVEVMRAMRILLPEIRFGGAGGDRMRALCTEKFDNWAQKAAVTGLWDVLKNYPYFRRKFREMLLGIRHQKPDAVVLVDYPGFNLRLANALRAEGYRGKILYYISPQVWAWNRRRIPKMARILDLMICVFPFEAPMYEASGLHTVFAGHPLLEALMEKRAPTSRQDSFLGLFPGSREKEVKRNFPVMVEAARIVSHKLPHIRFEAAAANNARAELMCRIAGDFPVRITTGDAHTLMQTATAGLVCSGTATLEAAFFALPYALVYKTAWLTFEVGKRLVDIDSLGIVNILNNYRRNPPSDPRLPASSAPHLVREFIQNDATPDALANESIRLLQDNEARGALQASFAETLSSLHPEGASKRAAAHLLEALNTGNG